MEEQELPSSNQIDVSIIIPNFNSIVVGQTIQSIVNQNSKFKFEIIVVGLDKHGLVPCLPNLIHIETTDRIFAGMARNVGVVASSGDLLIFIDSDCVTQPNFIDEHYLAHLRHPDSLVGGAVLFPEIGFFHLADNVSTFHEYMPHLKEGRRRVLPSIAMSITRKMWEQTDGFSLRPTSQDSDFTESIKSLGYEAWFCPAIRVTHFHPRIDFFAVLRHARQFGKHSTLFKRYPGKKPTLLQKLRRYPLLLSLFSPLLALGLLAKIILVEKIPFKYFGALPIVFISKLYWFVGAKENEFGNIA